MTGFHAIHVFGGLVVFAIILMMAYRGRFGVRQPGVQPFASFQAAAVPVHLILELLQPLFPPFERALGVLATLLDRLLGFVQFRRG